MPNPLDIARYIIIIVLSLLWLFIAIVNWRIAWRQWKQPNAKGPSIVPLFGALLAWGILALIPVSNYHSRIRWVWILWLLEYGSLPYFISAVLYLTHEAWIHNPLFLVMTLHGNKANGTQCLLTFYRNGDCILKQTKMPPPHVELSLKGKWRQEPPKTLIVIFATLEFLLEEIETTGRYQLSTASDSKLLEGVQFSVK